MSNIHFDDISCCEYLDGALPESERTVFDLHLATCENCRAMVGEARHGQAGLQSLHLRPAPDLSARVMAAIRKLPAPQPPSSPESSPGNRRFIGWLTALASAAIAVALLFYMPRTLPTGKTPNPRSTDQHGMTITSLPSETVSAQSDSSLLGVITAKGRWQSSSQPVKGLFKGTTEFVTGSDGHLTLAVGTGGRVAIQPESHVAFDADLMRVKNGSVWCEFKPLGSKAPYTIRAGLMTARVIGTRFGVQVASEAGCIELFEGKLEISAASEPVRMLTAGSSASYDGKLSFEKLEGSALARWQAAFVSKAGHAEQPNVASRTEGVPMPIEHPVCRPSPASGAAEVKHPDQSASEQASTTAAPDDPLSTLLDHQPGAN